MAFLDGRYSIAGVGETPYSRDSGATTEAMAVDAINAAAVDAGISPTEIDGILCYHENDSALPYHVAPSLGTRLDFYLDTLGGGNAAEALIGLAALAIHGGLAKTVAVYRAMNGRSGQRVGGAGGWSTARPTTSEASFWQPYGLSAAVQKYALVAQRYFHQYGATSMALGEVAVQLRRHANLNPKSMMRDRSLTIEEHQASRLVADPLRLYDCCLETDGACAVIVTSRERARDLRRKPIILQGVAGRVCGPFPRWDISQPDATDFAGKYAAPIVYGLAGVGPQDIDLAAIYDCFTITVLRGLEDYGFCLKGEAAALVASGALDLDGRLPTNTGGGLMSESYMNGLNNIIELVRQLRGEADDGCAGAHDFDRAYCRQVRDPELALSGVSIANGYASALILST